MEKGHFRPKRPLDGKEVECKYRLWAWCLQGLPFEGSVFPLKSELMPAVEGHGASRGTLRAEGRWTIFVNNWKRSEWLALVPTLGILGFSVFWSFLFPPSKTDGFLTDGPQDQWHFLHLAENTLDWSWEFCLESSPNTYQPGFQIKPIRIWGRCQLKADIYVWILLYLSTLLLTFGFHTICSTNACLSPWSLRSSYP